MAVLLRWGSVAGEQTEGDNSGMLLLAQYQFSDCKDLLAHCSELLEKVRHVRRDESKATGCLCQPSDLFTVVQSHESLFESSHLYVMPENP